MVTVKKEPDQLEDDLIIPPYVPKTEPVPKEVRFWNALGPPTSQRNQSAEFQYDESFHNSPQKDQQ